LVAPEDDGRRHETGDDAVQHTLIIDAVGWIFVKEFTRCVIRVSSSGHEQAYSHRHNCGSRPIHVL
jgi:hypothetical protein